MFSTLRTRFGIPGVISVMALVFAMLGGAYAAQDSSGGKATASKTKVLQGARGPKGATGPAGPAGPAGPQGPKGENGSNGSDGSSGSDGQSVSVEPEPPGSECFNGGIKVTSTAGDEYVCDGLNGNPGLPGPDGSPWTVGGTLPPSSAPGCPCTETGTWMISTRQSASYGEGLIGANAPISFPIPLAAALPASNVHFVTSPGGSCTGTVENPTAASGHLCVYGELYDQAFSPITPEIVPALFSGSGATRVGALIYKEFSASITEVFGNGSWAVTG